MNKEIINIMKQIKIKYGINTLLNNKTLYSYLSDYLKNNYIGEINLIICCLKENIPQKILNLNGYSPVFIEQQSEYIINKYFFNKAHVIDSINCWYEVLYYTENTLNHHDARHDSNTDLQNSHLNLYNTTKDEMRRLNTENKALKQKLKSITDVCDGRCFIDYEDLPFGNEEHGKDNLISELQPQIYENIAIINRLHVTIDALIDKYTSLRKTAGLD